MPATLYSDNDMTQEQENLQSAETQKPSENDRPSENENNGLLGRYFYKGVI